MTARHRLIIKPPGAYLPFRRFASPPLWLLTSRTEERPNRPLRFQLVCRHESDPSEDAVARAAVMLAGWDEVRG